jgi:hypothetical protein
MKIIITENQYKKLLKEQGNKQNINIPLFGDVDINDLETYGGKNNYIKVYVDKKGNLTFIKKPGFNGIASTDGFIGKINLNSNQEYPTNIKSKIKIDGGELPTIPLLQKKNDEQIMISALQIKYYPNKLNKKISEGEFFIRIGEYPLTKEYNGKVVPSVNAVPNGDIIINAIESENKNIGYKDAPEGVVGKLPTPVDIGDLFGDNKSFIDVNSDKYKNFIKTLIDYVKSGGKVSKIIITSSASKFPATCCDDDKTNWANFKNENDPTGNSDAPNYKLTVARAQHTKEALQKSLGGKDSLYELKPLGSNGPTPKKGDDSNSSQFAKNRYVKVEIKD